MRARRSKAASATPWSTPMGVPSWSSRPADVQDRDGGAALLAVSRPIFPFVERVFADGAYDSDRVADACSATLEIVRKIKDQVGFVVLPLDTSCRVPPAEPRGAWAPGDHAIGDKSLEIRIRPLVAHRPLG